MATPLTNIGTSVPPRVIPGPAQRFRPGTGQALPLGLPQAVPEGQDPGPQVESAEPLWVSRWQPSKTPVNQKRPWVTGYRSYVKGNVYPSKGRIDHYRIEMMFIDGHQHWYEVPEDLFFAFRVLTKSVGEWLHDNILRPMKSGAASFPNGPM